MDKVPQGKRQTLDLKLVLAQGTNCRARSGISLHLWVCTGEGSSAGVRKTHVRLTRHGSPVKLPLGSTDPAKKRELLSLPATVQWPALSQQGENKSVLYSSPQRNRNPQKEIFASPEPHILLLWQTEPCCTSPARGGRRSHLLPSLRGAPAWAAFQTWRA